MNISRELSQIVDFIRKGRVQDARDIADSDVLSPIEKTFVEAMILSFHDKEGAVVLLKSLLHKDYNKHDSDFLLVVISKIIDLNGYTDISSIKDLLSYYYYIDRKELALSRVVEIIKYLYAHHYYEEILIVLEYVYNVVEKTQGMEDAIVQILINLGLKKRAEKFLRKLIMNYQSMGKNDMAFRLENKFSNVLHT